MVTVSQLSLFDSTTLVNAKPYITTFHIRVLG
jgi:hypothetical protein